MLQTNLLATFNIGGERGGDRLILSFFHNDGLHSHKKYFTIASFPPNENQNSKFQKTMIFRVLKEIAHFHLL